MIIDKNVLLKISSTNFTYYKTKGYEFKKGDSIIIDVKDLQFGTGVKVNVKCDICEKENKIYLQKYNMNKEKYGVYTCRKCSKFKRIKTTIERYGVDNASQCINIKNKKKLTTLKNYGFENPSQSKIIKEQKKKTMLKNYGVEYVLQSKELVENIKNTKISKYGDENFNNRVQSLNTCMKKYGVENPSQLETIKKKKCETSIKNYGVEHPMQNIDIFTKHQKSSYRLHKYKNIFYQGSYEKDFLDIYFDKITLNELPRH